MNFFDDNIEQQDAELPPDQEDVLGLNGAVAEEDGSSYAITSRTSNRNTYILLSVCLLAIVGVWFAGFRHNKADESENADDPVSKLEIVLAKLVGIKNTENSKELVDAFYELPGAKQIKLQELNKNPFVIEQKVEAEDISAVRQINRQQVLATEMKGLKLGTILTRSEGNMCLINGVVYKAGDQVTESFKLKEIKVDSVILEAEDFECVLEM